MATAESTIVFPLYPGVTQLDFTAPLEVLGRLPGAQVIVASVRGGSLSAGPGLTLAELPRLEEVERCTVLCVPGGPGVVSALIDEAFLRELRRLAQLSRHVASVCTGSLLLGAAGLLAGKRAACHWAWRDLLASFGALPDSARVVRDGNVITGGGVTAGIDLSLSLAAEMCGRDFAEQLALAIEYAPEPPFEGGRPELSRPDVLAAVREQLAALRPAREAAVETASKRLALRRDEA
jgi:transcriptional regulator GlxA family with amidase domain